MKRIIQLTLASIVAVVGLSLAPALSSPTQAISVFDGACGGSSGGDGGGVTADDAPSGIGGGGVTADDAPSGIGDSAGSDSSGGGGSSSSLCGATKQDDAPDIIKNVITTILIVLGMVAVIMIVIGGIRYTTSNGDASAIKSAKDTILYAVIGLVVAIFSFAIVNFVIERIS